MFKQVRILVNNRKGFQFHWELRIIFSAYAKVQNVKNASKLDDLKPSKGVVWNAATERRPPCVLSGLPPLPPRPHGGGQGGAGLGDPGKRPETRPVLPPSGGRLSRGLGTLVGSPQSPRTPHFVPKDLPRVGRLSEFGEGGGGGRGGGERGQGEGEGPGPEKKTLLLN